MQQSGVAYLLLSLTACLMPASLLAASCRIKPPEMSIDTATAWGTGPVPGMTIKPLITKEFNGVEGTNYALVTVGPNKHYAAHGHVGSVEVIFVHKGKASMSYWAPGMPEKTTVEVGPGSFHYAPVGAFHDIVTGEEGVEFLATMSPGPFTWELFKSWPDSLDAHGHIVPVFGAAGCPPGQEADGEHAAEL